MSLGTPTLITGDTVFVIEVVPEELFTGNHTPDPYNGWRLEVLGQKTGHYGSQKGSKLVPDYTGLNGNLLLFNINR